jgi:hypothetical protein
MVSTHQELSRRLAELEKSIVSNDKNIRTLFQTIRQLMARRKGSPRKSASN